MRAVTEIEKEIDIKQQETGKLMAEMYVLYEELHDVVESEIERKFGIQKGDLILRNNGKKYIYLGLTQNYEFFERPSYRYIDCAYWLKDGSISQMINHVPLSEVVSKYTSETCSRELVDEITVKYRENKLQTYC